MLSPEDDTLRRRRIPTAAGSVRSEPSDLISQALKALSIRSPFDTEASAASSNPAIPAAVAAFLSRHPDGRKKPFRPPATSTVWDQTEDYFRPLTLDDINHLRASLQSVPSPQDSLLAIPVLAQQPEAPDAGAAELRLSSVPIPVEQHEKLEPLVAEDESSSSLCSSSSSTNWILSNKHRFLLTSERPNKKRKLLAGDAGLDKLLQLPNCNELLRCDMCCLGPTSMNSNQLLCCGSCKVKVHQKCYGVSEVPVGGWLCSWCKHLESSGETSKQNDCSRPCVLCPNEGGALKASGRDRTRGRPSTNGTMKYAHLFCSLWAPEVYVEDTGLMEPVLNIGGIQETRRKLVCYLCKVKHGVCVRCSHGTCRTSFHPLCARESKLKMEIWGKFGCDNVELRAFCSKHSGSQHTCNIKQSEIFGVNTSDHSSLAKPPYMVLPTSKFRLKLNPSKREKSLTQVEVQNSEEIVRAENSSEQYSLTPELRREVSGSLENTPTSSYPSLVLRKLIDRGKVNVDDVASDMGISTNSLEAALLGETASFSPGLRLKIVKWLQDSAHILRVASGSEISPGDGVAKIDSMNAAKVTRPSAPGNLKVSGLEVSGAVVNKSLPSEGRASRDIGILKDNRTPHPSAATLTARNCNGKLVHENDEIPVVISDDLTRSVNKNSSIHNQDFQHEGLKLSETIFEGTANRGDSSTSFDIYPGNKGNPVKRESNDLSEAQHQEPTASGRLSTFGSDADHADEVGIIVPDTLEKGFQSNSGCDGDMAVSCIIPDLITDASCSSYVHPFIKRKLVQVQKYAISEHQFGEASFVGQNASVNLYCDQPPLFSCTDINHALDKAIVDQSVKAKGVMELSPVDEVEAELFYLQSRLLDKSVTVRHSCENLISKVVKYLPKEMDALNKRAWDQALVNQFVREVKEVKKRGKKERKHKEAQAVLAAAAAAAAASSRNSSLRKDANDEIVSYHQEQSPLTVTTTTARAKSSSPLVSRAKESSRSTMGKVSSENLGICQITYFGQENALCCDICKRAETMLNRISVCSVCKVPIHLDCYGTVENQIGPWKCELCEEISSQSRSPRNEAADNTGGVAFCCALCGFTTGAFRKSIDGQWVHVFCDEWLLKSRYKREQQNQAERMDTISNELNLQSCTICQRSIGVCLKCSSGPCQITFHPFCARNAGLYMNMMANGSMLQHRAYCEKHSIEQREANQHHGADEIERIRQIRGELERLRLLCERITRREKLKKELVVCAHDVLASERDYVSTHVLVRRPFLPPGVSSESVTTSINRSYSGVMQRSDDITDDSTLSGKNAARLSVHKDINKMTDDSSTSQLSSKQDFPNQVSLGDKQVPQKRASVEPLCDSVSKIRKRRQTFQKELVMTSDQALRQNQRLPKGFAYVPDVFLTRKKTTISDLEPHESPELGV